MALYAFDGTWNKPDSIEDDSDLNTNVIKFAEHYAALHDAADDLRHLKSEYANGIGNRFHRAGKIVGGLTGAGGRDRVHEMLNLCAANIAAGDRNIHVIGFSRGAALAVHFCNKLADGIPVAGGKVEPKVQFLGLWDTVPAFGIPGAFFDWAADINIGWDLDLPTNVERCAHALALNETRQAFNVHRLDAKGRYPHVSEMWFRGVHSDVGGGNGNVGLQSIPLLWMMQMARSAIPFTDEQLAAVSAGCDASAPVSRNTGPGEQIDRPFLDGDENRLHPTAARRLAPGEAVTEEVDSRLLFDFSGILIERGAAYTFTPDPAGRWTDDTIECDASGWPENLNRSNHFLDKIKNGILKSGLVGLARRVRAANWFELCACPGFDDDHAFPVGKGQHLTTPWVCAQTAPLTFFANDALHPVNKYDNNSGSLRVTVRRVS